MRNRMLAVSLVVAAASFVGCSSMKAPSGPLSVPLAYRPTELLTGTQTIIRGPLTVSVVYERTKKDAIGQNVEKTTPVAIISADNPAKFVENVLTQQLQSRGATLATDKPAKKLVVHLTNFWTDEGNTYKCQVGARGEVLDVGGKQLWEGIASGSAERFGRSLKAENYQEVFSDATIKMVNSLLSDSGLAAALK